jgi:hypothetical protein
MTAAGRIDVFQVPGRALPVRRYPLWLAGALAIAFAALAARRFFGGVPAQILEVRTEVVTILSDAPALRVEPHLQQVLAIAVAGRLQSLAKRGHEVAAGEVVAALAIAKKDAAALAKLRRAYQRAVLARDRQLAVLKTLGDARTKLFEQFARLEQEVRQGVGPAYDTAKKELARLNGQLSRMAKRERKPRSRLGPLDSTVQALEAALAKEEQRLAPMTLHAPFAGVVKEIYVRPHSTVAPGTEVLRVVDASTMVVTFAVPQADVRQAGGMARVVSAGVETEAPVRTVRLTATGAEIGVELRDPKAIAAPPTEMYLVRRRIENGAWLPKGALTAGVVFLADGRTARTHPVVVLQERGDRVAVQGLPPVSYVVASADGVHDGAHLR